MCAAGDLATFAVTASVRCSLVCSEHKKQLQRNVVVESCFSVELIPLPRERRKDERRILIVINSAPDESAKDSSYFHVHGSQL